MSTGFDLFALGHPELVEGSVRVSPGTPRVLLLGAVVLALGFGLARAHPVAQGSIDLTFHSDRIEFDIRVSPEEVFVAGLNDQSAKAADSVPALLKIHGSYLLDHLFLTLDGVPLQGTLVVSPNALDAKAPRNLVEYRLSFPVDHDPKPTLLEIRENLLNEIMYAVGNRWEASFFIRTSRDGSSFDTGQLLTSRRPITIDARPGAKPNGGWWRLASQYLQQGIWHILSGYDHLLFIGALVLAVRTVWDLVKVIGAFTLAHTITLTLAVLDVIRLPGNIVEPMVSATIVFVALQNVVWPQSAQGAPRLWLAFFFGLIHGLGFAGGLLAAMHGLSGFKVGLAIVAFSLGVELGHQVVVLPVYFGMRAIRHLQKDPARRELFPRLATRYGSVLITLVGLYYLNDALHLRR